VSNLSDIRAAQLVVENLDLIGPVNATFPFTFKNCRVYGDLGTSDSPIRLAGNVTHRNHFLTADQTFGGEVFATGRVGKLTSLPSSDTSTVTSSFGSLDTNRIFTFSGVLDEVEASLNAGVGSYYSYGYEITLSQTQPAIINLYRTSSVDEGCYGFFNANNMTSISGAVFNFIGQNGATISQLEFNANAATSVAFTTFRLSGDTYLIAQAGLSLSGCTSLNFGSGSFIACDSISFTLAANALVNIPSNMPALVASGGFGSSYAQFFFVTAWNQAAVDACLAWAAAQAVASDITGATLTIGGTSAAPSAAGLADIDTLVANGWTVTTN